MKVLYVEDDRLDADLTRRAVAGRNPGIELDLAIGLVDARVRLGTGAGYDLVMTDLNLPDGSGLQLITEIRERGLSLAAVALTGSSQPEAAVAALKAGADDFVLKRDDYLARVPDVLEAALGRFRAEAARRARPLRVLYAEDSAIDADLADRHFEQYAPNIRLDVVQDVPDLLARLPQTSAQTPDFDVLLLDWKLPGSDALEILKMLREERGLDLPVVLVTGRGDGEIAAQAFRFGAANYVVKYPGYLFALPSVLEAAHDRAQLLHEQKALRESERRYRELVSAVPGAVYTFRVDAQGRRSMPFISEGIGDMLGIAPAEIVADVETAFRRIPPEAVPAMERSIADSVRSGNSWLHEFPILAAGGEERWLRGQSVPRMDADGSMVWHGVFIDITDRKRAEQALRLSESNLRTIADNATVGISVLQEGRRVFANRRAAEMLGYAIEEFLGLSVAEVIHPDSLAGILDRMRRRAAGEALPSRHEFMWLAKDGRGVPMEGNYATTMWNGRPALIVFVVEIAERKTRDDALLLLSTGMAHLSGEAFFSEMALRIAEHLEVEIGFVNKVQGPANTRARSLGLSVDGRILPEQEFEIARTPCESVIGRQPAIYPGQVRELFPAFRMASDFAVEGYAAVPLFDRHGKAVGAVGVMSRSPLRHPAGRIESLLRLFAVRAAAEIERLAAESRFKDLFELAPDASIIVNEAGTITAMNRTAQALFGYSREELEGISVDMLVPEGRRAAHAQMRRGFLEKAESRPMGSGRTDLYARRKDGTTFPADIDLHPLQSDEGTLVVGTVRDLTVVRQEEEQRKVLELQLRQAQKLEAVGTLAGGIAHDFNNIIGAILGNAMLARQDIEDGHPALDSIAEIDKASRRARDLVQQILAFSRQQVAARQVVALGTVVGEVVQLLRATVPENISFGVQCADSLPNVSADPTQIHQVLMNLCTNASHAMEGHPGTISILLDSLQVDLATAAARHDGLRPGRWVHVSVRDTGKGMDKYTRERMFEPFFTTKSVEKGSGLGMSVVHGIVQSHEGMIMVDSSPGAGTTVHVYFPATAQALAEEEGPAECMSAPQVAAGHVLYLDDDEALVWLVTRMLERQGYRVSAYTLAQEALDSVRAEPARFDLVVSDYNMPGMSGLDVAREIAGIRPDLPVAVTSGYITDELRMRAPQFGVKELIYKPNAVDELCDSVRRLIDQARRN